MGIPTAPGGLSEVLFSKTRRQVLRLLFGRPERSYHFNEIVRLAGVGIGSVTRELDKLTGSGLVTMTKAGNQNRYQANRGSPIFDEIRGIVLKTFGLADVLRAALEPLAERIAAAFVYGSVAKGTDTAASDIDLLLIGDDLTYADLVTALAEAEQQLGRSVNPTLYSTEEFRRKLGAGAAFLERVMEQPKIFLLGATDDIPTA
ncbi:MAG: nucleotidyltransferase domain-containing protein [Chromatiales bacterium]|jgi:predicted nucleotidyltransferase